MLAQNSRFSGFPVFVLTRQDFKVFRKNRKTLIFFVLTRQDFTVLPKKTFKKNSGFPVFQFFSVFPENLKILSRKYKKPENLKT
jgi:hypothetical protein